MNDNEYKKMFQKIEVPSDLKDKTLNSIRKEQEKYTDNTYKRIRFRRLAGFVAAASVTIFAFFYAYNNLGQGQFIKTDIGSEHIEYVELKDGYLDFASADGLEENRPTFGLINQFQKKWNIQEYTDYLGESVELPYLPSGFEKKNDEITAKYTKSGELKTVIGMFTYQDGERKKIIYTISDTSFVPTISLSKDKLSVINGMQFYTSHDEASEKYCAFFELDGRYYELSSQFLDQKEFIKIIYHFIQKK